LAIWVWFKISHFSLGISEAIMLLVLISFLVVGANGKSGYGFKKKLG